MFGPDCQCRTKPIEWAKQSAVKDEKWTQDRTRHTGSSGYQLKPQVNEPIRVNSRGLQTVLHRSGRIGGYNR